MLEEILPFRIGPFFEDILGWEIAPDMTVGEALTNEALTSLINTHGQGLLEEIEQLREAGRLKVDFYLEEGDGYMEEEDRTVHHRTCVIVELSPKGMRSAIN